MVFGSVHICETLCASVQSLEQDGSVDHSLDTVTIHPVRLNGDLTLDITDEGISRFSSNSAVTTGAHFPKMLMNMTCPQWAVFTYQMLDPPEGQKIDRLLDLVI